MKNPFAILAVAIVVALSSSCVRGPSSALIVGSPTTIALANDNRVPAGTLRNGVLRLDLDAVWAGWRPDADVDTAVTVRSFAERGELPTIPGPLVRIPHGTEIRATVRNGMADSTLIVHGLRAGAVGQDTFSVAPGGIREITFTPPSAGTFLYWATTSHSSSTTGTGRDGLLSGAIVVDPAGVVPDPRERVFVISLIDHLSDSSLPPPHEEIWEIAVNGRSWPHTERLSYAMGDTAQWRFINATNRPHPMHLHGFHFLVTAKGDGAVDTAYASDRRRYAVTELMNPGSTFRLEWSLTRPGKWLVHCHMIPHIVPYPERPDSTRHHDVHAVERHPLESMAGLVLGVDVTDPAGSYTAPAEPEVAAHRLFIQEARGAPGMQSRKGYVLQRGVEPARDSVAVPGTRLIVVRGQRNRVTIVNRLRTPTSVHWHGMELESVFDGVAGFSGLGSARAPLLAPGDSFVVWFTPPRAGTYMFHSHMDEEDQIASGMYAPLIVLEPGEVYDPSSDLTMMVGLLPNERGGAGRALNGARTPAPMRVQPGKTYRLRLINMMPAPRIHVQLAADSTVQLWRLVSKDGATSPPALTAPRPASLFIGVGEAYDFSWTAPASESVLKIQVMMPPGEPLPAPLLQRFIAAP
ncbi:MAG: multicopper oxidase domain-containing protein [Gemmatimonadota bacterium]|nr:multicopper oxidase domain-containing protein [Gemmatimonadota bacterium]